MGLPENITHFPETSNNGPSANEPLVRSETLPVRLYFS